MSSISSASNVAASILNSYTNTTSLMDKLSSAIVESKAASNSAYSNKTSLGRYINSTDSSDVSAKKLFEKLSLDVGSDGKTITKNQLDSYIKNAQNGTTTIPEQELSALLTIQENWDDMANSDDEINYYSVAGSGYKNTLLSIVPEEKENAFASIQDDFNESTIKAYSTVINAALSGLSSGEEDESSLSSLLSTLLSNTTDEEDGDSANAIATIINLLAAKNSSSTVELDA